MPVRVTSDAFVILFMYLTLAHNYHPTHPDFSAAADAFWRARRERERPEEIASAVKWIEKVSLPAQEARR